MDCWVDLMKERMDVRGEIAMLGVWVMLMISIVLYIIEWYAIHA